MTMQRIAISSDRFSVVAAAGRALRAATAAVATARGTAADPLASMLPALPQQIAALRAAGRVEVWAGRIRGAASYGDTFVVDVLPHGRRLHSSERYDWIVDCT